MSGDEAFLARWSRRKRAAAEAERRKPASPQAAPETEPPATADPDAPMPPALPPIEEISAATDVRTFLAPGVPAALTRAALRRAWTVDPEIRDFIGLSENSWDFTAPDGVPGFGSLTADEVRRVAAEFFDPKPAETAPPLPCIPETQPDPPSAISEEPDTSETNIAAAQHEDSPVEPPRSLARRRHGGALPQ